MMRHPHSLWASFAAIGVAQAPLIGHRERHEREGADSGHGACAGVAQEMKCQRHDFEAEMECVMVIVRACVSLMTLYRATFRFLCRWKCATASRVSEISGR